MGKRGKHFRIYLISISFCSFQSFVYSLSFAVTRLCCAGSVKIVCSRVAKNA